MYGHDSESWWRHRVELSVPRSDATERDWPWNHSAAVDPNGSHKAAPACRCACLIGLGFQIQGRFLQALGEKADGLHIAISCLGNPEWEHGRGDGGAKGEGVKWWPGSLLCSECRSRPVRQGSQARNSRLCKLLEMHVGFASLDRLPRWLEKVKHIIPNSGLMVIYHGRK